MSKVKFNGKLWNVTYTVRREMPKKTWGTCNDKNSLIRVRTDLSTKNFLDTYIHEMLHAANFQCFSEEFVEQTATEIAKALMECEHLSIEKISPDDPLAG
ncbi:MAG: hypothetical protein ACPHEP_01455 [Acidimicrobiales bacterium]